MALQNTPELPGHRTTGTRRPSPGHVLVEKMLGGLGYLVGAGNLDLIDPVVGTRENSLSINQR